MKKQIMLSLVFAAAVATPARAYDGRALDFNDYKLPPAVEIHGPYDSVPRGRAPGRFKEPQCDVRERAKADLGGGWSVGVGGSLGRPKIALNWRMSLQPQLENRTAPQNCALFDLRR